MRADALTARLTRRGDAIECEAAAEMERPIKAVALVVRGVPRGRISAGGAPFFDPRDDEVLLGYPFSGGDLFGPQGNGGLTTPLVLVQPRDADAIVALSSLDDRVRTKRVLPAAGRAGLSCGGDRGGRGVAAVHHVPRAGVAHRAGDDDCGRGRRALRARRARLPDPALGRARRTCPTGCGARRSS